MSKSHLQWGQQTARWDGYNWQRPSLGRVRIARGVRPYGGKWGELRDINGDRLGVYFPPDVRDYKLSEIDKADEQAQAALAKVNK